MLALLCTLPKMSGHHSQASSTHLGPLSPRFKKTLRLNRDLELILPMKRSTEALWIEGISYRITGLL